MFRSIQAWPLVTAGTKSAAKTMTRSGDTGGGSSAERHEMSNHRTRRITRETAEQLLLRGTPEGAAGPLAGLLATAAAPARTAELAGEQTALAAFRIARLTPAAELRRESMIQTTLAKLLTVKVAAVAIGVTALGGVALASGTGALPNQPADKTPKAHSTSASDTGPKSEGAGGRKDPTATRSPKAKKDKAAKESKEDKAAKGTPSPSMVGLCKAYAAKPAGQRGKSLQSSAFTALIKSAGGTQNVAGYCKLVLAAKAGDAPKHPNGKPKPAHPGKPAAPGQQRKATPAPDFTAN